MDCAGNRARHCGASGCIEIDCRIAVRPDAASRSRQAKYQVAVNGSVRRPDGAGKTVMGGDRKPLGLRLGQDRVRGDYSYGCIGACLGHLAIP